MTKLGLRRRQEQYDALLELNDRDLCEMIRAHFASHPCMSGEKALKDAAGQYLAMNDPNLSLPPEDREAYAHNFAATRIRETKLEYAPCQALLSMKPGPMTLRLIRKRRET